MDLSCINVVRKHTACRNSASLPVFALRDAADRAHCCTSKNKEAVHEASFVARSSSIVFLSSVSGHGDSARPIHRGPSGSCRAGPYPPRSVQRVHGRREEQHLSLI